MKRRHLEESFVKIIMAISLLVVTGSLGAILGTILLKGLPAVSLEMLIQTPQGGYYLGEEGGILNAILGSIYLATGATFLAILISLPVALYLHTYARKSMTAGLVRLVMDVLWGVPSIVYGAFGFLIMLAIGLRASLLGGIMVLTILEIPIMTRAMDEVIRLMPAEIEAASLALGATRLETTRVVIRQMSPGIVTGILLAFGRAVGDAASVLFTAGYTDRIPSSLFRPAASLPLAVFFQLGTPYPAVQERAYASALVLTVIVLIISLGSRWLSACASTAILSGEMMNDAHVEVRNLSVFYGDICALKDICLKIPRNQVTIIIGPSGCGKTTLLKSINRFLELTQTTRLLGEVLIDNVNIYLPGTDVTEVRKKAGLLAQRPSPLPMSIFDNVAYGLRLHGMCRKGCDLDRAR